MFFILVNLTIILNTIALVSEKYKNAVFACRDLSAGFFSIGQALVTETLFIILIFLILKDNVNLKMTISYTILQFISMIVANVYRYTNIFSNQIFFKLDKLIAILEISMMLVMSYYDNYVKK